jgi:Peptidase M15
MSRVALFAALLVAAPAANASAMPATPFTDVAGEPYVQDVPAVIYVREAQKSGVDPTTAAVLQRIDQALAGVIPGLTVKSAYRSAAYNASVGGARSSQHIQGKAIDLDLSSFMPEQKRAVLAAVIAQPEVKGIGVYDAGMNVLHFDTRSGDRVAWGPDYAPSSLGRVLNGYTRPMLTGWLNGTAPAAPTATASVVPLPILRPGEGGPRGDALAQASLAAPLADQARAEPTGQSLRAASSWLAVELQGGRSPASSMGGMSPAPHMCIASAPSHVTTVLFGVDAVVRTASSGDINTFNVMVCALTNAAPAPATPEPPNGGGPGLDGVLLAGALDGDKGLPPA